MAIDLFKLLGTISIDSDNAEKSIDGFLGKVKETHPKLGSAFEKIGGFATKATDTIWKGMLVAGGAVVGFGAKLLSLTESTKDYRLAMGKLEAAFETAGSDAEEAKDVYEDLYRVLGDTDRAVEAANHLAQLTTAEKYLSDWTLICQGVYATFGDSLPIEGLTEAINHTAKLGEVQGVLADALEWAGVNVEDFNAKLATCTSESQREQEIRETLNGLYADAAANYEETAEAVLAENEAQAKLDETLARLGETMSPINTALTELLNDILVQLEPYITDFIDNHLPDLQELLSNVGTKIGEAISWIVDNWDTIKSVAGVVLGVVAAVKTLNTVLGITNAILSTGILGIIMAVIGAVAALVVAIDKFMEALRDAGYEVDWFSKSQKAAFSDMEGAISATLDRLDGKIGLFSKSQEEGFAVAWEAIKKVFSDGWQQCCDVFSDALEIGKNIVEKLKQGISNAWDGLKNWFNNLWDNLFNRDVNVNVGGLVKPGASSTGTHVGDSLAQSVINGTHATGLDYVPFDGYVAELHRGEMVVPAEEASVLRSGAGSDIEGILLAILDAVQDGNSRETVMRLNNREFARMVKAVT